MHYSQFVQMCLSYGFTYAPLSNSQYERIIKSGHLPETAYEIACDMESDAFWNLTEALEFYKDHK